MNYRVNFSKKLSREIGDETNDNRRNQGSTEKL